MTGFDAGKSFEHYVFLELIAYKYLNDKRYELFYWRTKKDMRLILYFKIIHLKLKLLLLYKKII